MSPVADLERQALEKRRVRRVRAEELAAAHGWDGDMFGPTPEAMLAFLEESDPILAAMLRRVRDEIAEKGRGQWSQRALEWQRAQERAYGAQLLREKQLPESVLLAIETGTDEHGRPLEELQPLWRLRHHVSRGARLIFILGAAGTGKTFSACQWLAEQESGLYVEGAYLGSLLPSWKADTGEIWKYVHAPALVIDDLGRGWSNIAERGRLEELIGQRYQSLRHTVATTNLTPREVLSTYGDRVSDRVREVGAWVTCDERVRPSAAKMQTNTGERDGNEESKIWK